MKINLGLLIDTLNAKYKMDIIADENWIDVDITKIKVLRNGQKSYKQETLYIVDCTVIDLSHIDERINVIGFNPVINTNLKNPNINLFLVNGNHSETEILNQVLENITTLPNLKLPVEFVDALLKCENLSDFCNEVYDYMKNPMVLADADGRMIGCSKEMMKNDECWDQMRTSFLAEPDTEEGRNWSKMLRQSNLGGRAGFRLAPNGGRMIICPIHSYGTINGFICIPEVSKSRMNASHLELVNLIRSILVNSMNSFGALGHSLSTGQENFLAALIQGHDISPVRLSVMGKVMKVKFQYDNIYCVVIRNKGEISDKSYYKDIIRLIPKTYLYYSVYYNYDAVILINTKEKIEHAEEALGEFLKPLLKKDVRIGISRAYSQLGKTGAAYRQAASALKYGAMFDKENLVCRYDDMLSYNLLEEYPYQDRIREICLPGILQLQELDKINGTTYLETFNIYLLTGRSLKKTSEMLFIHRNTVSYHIGRCLEYLKADLDDGNTLFQLMLSLKILNYLRAKEQKEE